MFTIKVFLTPGKLPSYGYSTLARFVREQSITKVIALSVLSNRAFVAEEVRNLAMCSVEAAKNPANMIEESVKNSKGGVDIAVEVGKVLEEIVQSVREQRPDVVVMNIKMPNLQ